MRTKKDSIERFKQRKVQDISKQSKYLQEILTASLPRYYNYENQQEQVLSRMIAAKRSYANDSSIKWLQRNQDSPIKLKKTFSKSSRTQSRSPSKVQTILKTPRKSQINQQKSLYTSKQENDLDKHPYSIIKYLQNDQRDKPQTQKKVYKYRGVNQLKNYNLQEIGKLIDELKEKIHDYQTDRLSVTEQFLLMNYVDLKIQKSIEKSKIEQKKQKIKVPQVYNYACVRKQNDKNKQLMKALQQTNELWELYQLKVNYCPDILKNNGANDQIVIEMKKLYRQILKLGQQIQKHQETCIHKKVNKNFPDPCNQIIVKKIKTVIKRFKQIITIKRS